MHARLQPVCKVWVSTNTPPCVNRQRGKRSFAGSCSGLCMLPGTWISICQGNTPHIGARSFDTSDLSIEDLEYDKDVAKLPENCLLEEISSIWRQEISRNHQVDQDPENCAS
jgi:hypothetical protein